MAAESGQDRKLITMNIKSSLKKSSKICRAARRQTLAYWLPAWHFQELQPWSRESHQLAVLSLDLVLKAGDLPV